MVRKAGDVDIDNDAYLNIISRGGLFVPSRSLPGSVCSNFGIPHFVRKGLWLYLYLSKHRQAMSCAVMDHYLILPVSPV